MLALLPLLLPLAVPEPLVIESAPTQRVLLNPGMGLYAQCGTRLSDADYRDTWWWDVVAIGYFRLDWVVLEPGSPDDDMEAYFGPVFDRWVGQMGKRVAFRVMSENPHGAPDYVTPKWVFDRGVPGVEHRGVRDQAQLDPVFWDDRYLDEAVAFIHRLGRVLDGRPGLEFVDIGQIGEWGEMHLGLHIPHRWTLEEMERTGYTEAKYIAAYRRIIDAYAEAFPNTRVFLNVGGYGQINDYAALRGMHFRQDGLHPGGPSANVGERFYRPYADRGVIGNYEFHSGYQGMLDKGWDLAETLEVGLSVPVSYLNTNLFGVGQLGAAPPEVQALLTDTARRIGYRFGVDRVETRSPIRVTGQRPARVPLRVVWANRGVAPCYESYAVELGLLSADGRPPVTERLYPDPPTTRWAPGATVETASLLRLPADTAPGTYTLAVRLLLPERPEASAIQLDLEPLADGWHRLGEIQAVAAEPTGGAAFVADFDEGDEGWQPAAGMAMSRVPGRQGSALRLEGSQPDGWGLGALRVPVEPASRYRLSAWVRYDRFEAADARPTLKAGLNRADGGWITNANSGVYDVDRLGEWQELSVVFETPLDAASADISLEKGGRVPATADVLLDDVRLELLESP